MEHEVREEARDIVGFGRAGAVVESDSMLNRSCFKHQVVYVTREPKGEASSKTFPMISSLDPM